ncbi:MAG: SEC-C domain-containing protein [Armatimonadetes bacterium]|nr:SEC-C domain-containing protein [Armatimonadota bacterium]
MGVGRNQPCPCGSGKKYKKCCLAEQGSEPAPASAIAAIQRLEASYRVKVFRYLDRRLGKNWDDEAVEIFTGGGDPDPDDLELLVAWLLYHYEIDGAGRTPHDLFREEQADRLGAEERHWGQAQERAWLSVWEALRVDPARGMQMRDLLTGETRFVLDPSDAEMMGAGWGLLARVVDWQGRSALVGSHAQPLPPAYLAAALSRTCKVLPATPAAPDGLRGEEITLELLEAWEEIAGRMYDEGGFLPELRNSDGERLVLVRRVYAFHPSHRRQVLRGLGDLPGATVVQEGREILLHREDALLGSLAVRREELELEVNSLERDARLAHCLEQACPGLLRLMDHQISDPERVLAPSLPPMVVPFKLR